MPRQSFSLRPQRLVLSGEERVQNEFIKGLGPYFAGAKIEGHAPEFLAHTFNIWFTRWPLKLSDFEDTDFMQHRRQSIEKVGLYLVHSTWLEQINIFVRIFPTVYGGLVSPKRNRSILGGDT